MTVHINRLVMILAGTVFALVFSLSAQGQQSPADGPRYTNGTSLVRPADYREWTFL